MESKSFKLGEIAEFYESFKIYDMDNNDFIVPKELSRILDIYGDKPETLESVTKLFEEVEIDGNKQIDFPEYLALMSNKQNIDFKKNLKTIFGKIDKNEDKKIDADELKNFLVTLGLGTNKPKNEIKDGEGGQEENKKDDIEALAEAMILLADRDGDGHVDFMEFEKKLTDIYKSTFKRK